MKNSNKVVLSIGANKGNVFSSAEICVNKLKEKIFDLKSSSYYYSEPVEDANQDIFLNFAVSGKTDFSLDEFFLFIKNVEEYIGKEKERPKGPRKIDIDIIFFNDLVLKRDDLQIPHKKAHKRLFVLKPIMEIEPYYCHPELKKTVRDLYFELQTDKKVWLAGKS